MKIEKLNVNTLKIVLTVEELSIKDITIKDIESGKKKAQNFFFDIIEDSNFADEFLQDDTKLLVEASVSHDDKLVVTITKIYQNLSSSNREPKPQITSYQLYVFYDLDKLIGFVSQCEQKDLFVGNNTLYVYNGMYVLIFSKQTVYDKEFKKTFYTLTEYSDKYSSKNIIINIVKENADLLLEKNAINKINSYILE